MKRITTSVEPATYSALEDLARRDGVSTSHLLREAMERYVTERDQTLEPGPLPEWVGTLEGDGAPFAERDEELLEEWWAGDLATQPPKGPTGPRRAAPADSNSPRATTHPRRTR